MFFFWNAPYEQNGLGTALPDQQYKYVTIACYLRDAVLYDDDDDDVSKSRKRENVKQV